jgi:ABC-type polysaccharide/polyol phosphate transport system ATPase subunit
VTVIELENLSKRYQLGRRPAPYETLREAVAGLFRRRRSDGPSGEVWALREVDLAVEEGEAVGVIGRNGAGKTTLLKILAHITEPTSGVSRTRGRVGSLLEVGTGFHPELTGRDNVYLNGAILGMSRRDIRRLFDEIVEFAGVEPFLDTPLKRYSTGMQLRLAFAVAAHLEPSIVLVDEVLAVGDVEFQKKCLGHMARLEEEGRTVVFVSHDHGAIRRLCPRSVWIDEGGVKADGPTGAVLESYLAQHAPSGLATEVPARAGNTVAVERVEITDETGPLSTVRSGEPFVIRVRLHASEWVPDLDAAIYLRHRDGSLVLDEAWHETGRALERWAPPRRLEASVKVPGVLAAGEYVVGVWVASQDECFFFEDVLALQLSEGADDLLASVGKPRVLRSPTGLELRPL